MRGRIGIATSFLLAACASAGAGEDANAARPANLSAPAPANVAAPADAAAPTGNAMANAAAPHSATRLYVERGGLATGQPGLHASNRILFGRPRAQVIATVTALRGPPTRTGRNSDCGAGPIEFAAFGPLVINFQDGVLVGWTLDGASDPPITTQMDIGVGTTLADVGGDQGPPRVESTTLGFEFDFAGLGGFVDADRPDARVTSLHSGVTCFYR